MGTALRYKGGARMTTGARHSDDSKWNMAHALNEAAALSAVEWALSDAECSLLALAYAPAGAALADSLADFVAQGAVAVQRRAK